MSTLAATFPRMHSGPRIPHLPPRARAGLWPLLATIAVTMAGALGPVGPSTVQAAKRTATVSAAGTTWLLTRAALTDVAQSSAALATLAQGRVVELVPPSSRPLLPPGLSITPAFTVDSVTALQSMISTDTVPSWARAVLFDDEAWSLTPLNEQLYPVQAAQAAATLARAAGLSLWCAPGLDLVSELDPSAPSYWQGYLALNLAGNIGSVCGGLDLQAQSLERNSKTYQTFVAEAAAQATATHPGVALTAGLSTNPPGPAVSLKDLEAAVAGTISITRGFWLNIPNPGPWCPNCAPADPALAVELLTWL